MSPTNGKVSGVVVAGALLVLGFLTSCARQVAPPGGPTDVRPPVVVATVPAAFEIVTDLRTPIRFDFDERISERASGGTLDEALSISPAGGESRVKHARRSLTLEVEGGLRAGVVYRVTLGAVISDLFGNRMSDPFELVFSTGGEPVPTTLAGEVWDRATGRAASGATLLATAGDGLVHRSVADREGIYAFRYLPDGSFVVTAFDDVNRNGEVDSTEAQGAVTATLAVGDTILVDLAMLAPDTSAAIVTRATALDSVTVAVEFDDYLDPSLDPADVSVSLGFSGDSVRIGDLPRVIRVFEEGAYLAYVDSTARSFAALDSLDRANRAALADTASAPPVDSLRAPADTVVILDPAAGARPPAERLRSPPRRPTTLQGTSPGRTRDGRRVLPGRRLFVLLAAAIAFDVPYEVTVSGVLNINGLRDGGGSADFTLQPPPPDTTTSDSIGRTRQGSDSLLADSVRVDTLRVDTLLVDPVSAEPGLAVPSRTRGR